MIDLEEIKNRLAFVPPRVIGTLHQTLLTLIAHDLPGVLEELAAARAEVAEHRASLRAKEETIAGDCNSKCCEHNKGVCPTIAPRDYRP